jgi:methyl-accepting chemotaxis protein
MSLQNWSLSKRLFSVVAILIVPIAMLLYFLVSEKDSLIKFTQQEISGVAYLRALQPGYEAALNQESSGAAQLIEQADQQDQGRLSLTAQSREISAAFQAGHFDDAASKLSDAISMASDNSNITLDPDSDAYYVGDMLVNQAEGVLLRSRDLIAAARALQRERTEDGVVAFAVARDGLGGFSGNLSGDWAKAVKGNADGALQAQIGAMAEGVNAGLSDLAKAAKDDDYAAVLKMAPEVQTKITAILPKIDDSMAQLLDARIAGFHATVYARLALLLGLTAFGVLAATLVIRSISSPIVQIVDVLDKIRAGSFDVVLPSEKGAVEIIHLIQAAARYRDAAIRASETQNEAAHVERQLDLQRQAKLERLIGEFRTQIGEIVASVDSEALEMTGTARQLKNVASRAEKTSDSARGAAAESTANIRSVAAAAEQLTHSISEISSQIKGANDHVTRTTEIARSTDRNVSSLAGFVEKVGAVVEIIRDIASQTNLLALNAAIEAARAGAAGKGFAVVASEVKILAGYTAKATDDIAAQIGAIQDATREAVANIRAIAEAVLKIDQSTVAVATAVEEQNAATNEISRAILAASESSAAATANAEQVATVIGENNAEADRVTNTTGLLTNSTKRLADAVNAFLGDMAQDINNRRIAVRRRSTKAVVILNDGGRFPTTMADISDTGAKFVATQGLRAGAAFSIEFEDQARVSARVVWLKDGFAGARFDRPLSAAGTRVAA